VHSTEQQLAALRAEVDGWMGKVARDVADIGMHFYFFFFYVFFLFLFILFLILFIYLFI
jgi:hypothetical protein